MRIDIVNENSLMIWLGDEISTQVSEQLMQLCIYLQDQLRGELADLVPAYASVLLVLRPGARPVDELCQQLRRELKVVELASTAPQHAQDFEIPVCYAPQLAPDLDAVCAATGLSAEQLIQRHSQTRYRVYAIGFAPGFCFLGQLDKQLELPRRASPRTRVPAGSLAIAERQTAIYPRETPGGWHLIGRSRCDMLALCRDPRRPLRVGDRVRFRPISWPQWQAGA